MSRGRVVATLVGIAVGATLGMGVLAPALGAQDSTRLRVAVVGHFAQVRSARNATVTPQRDVALRGIELEWWAGRRGSAIAGPATRDGLGVALRAHQSTLGADDVAFYDVSALYGLGGLVERVAGARVRDAAGDLVAELAYGAQAGYEPATGLTHGEMHPLARLGVRAQTRIAFSPLSLEFRFSRYLPVGGPSGINGLAGAEGEGGLRWRIDRWPLDVAAGYRFQRMRVNRTAQEVSALRLELAWRTLR